MWTTNKIIAFAIISLFCVKKLFTQITPKWHVKHRHISKEDISFCNKEPLLFAYLSHVDHDIPAINLWYKIRHQESVFNEWNVVSITLRLQTLVKTLYRIHILVYFHYQAQSTFFLKWMSQPKSGWRCNQISNDIWHEEKCNK